jgi:2,2-dialkylglycine decarboxylase (pyruvate)
MGNCFLYRGYHDVTAASGAATFKIGRTGVGPLPQGYYAIPAPNTFKRRLGLNWRTELDDAFEYIDKICTGNLAAFAGDVACF